MPGAPSAAVFPRCLPALSGALAVGASRLYIPLSPLPTALRCASYPGSLFLTLPLSAPISASSRLSLSLQICLFVFWIIEHPPTPQPHLQFAKESS